MIVKSMSRKSTSFAQLYRYMHQAKTMGEALIWNIHSSYSHDILHAFYQNASHLNAHRNGNTLYHEIISLKYTKSVPLIRQQKALYDLCNKYLQARGKDLLGYGRIHLEQGHLHMHLMLSSNELNSQKRHRLTKAEFKLIQQHCEQYLQQSYPDLEQPSLYQKSPSSTRIHPEPSKPSSSTREHVRSLLIDILKQAGQQSIRSLLDQYDLKLYQRGKQYGVRYHGKSYRLKTLELEEPLLTVLDIPLSSLSPKEERREQRRRQLKELSEYYKKVQQEIDEPNIDG